MPLKLDSIAAIATAPGKGGIGVVRVSGSNLEVLCEGVLGKVPVPRLATYTSFKDGAGDILDQGIAIYFTAPNSYTGEDTLELQGHGGPAVLQLVLKRCLELGARLAQPGEFTQRAFLNGKLDLAQAESVADLIEASTDQAARSAMRSLQGEFSREVTVVLDQLIDLRVLVEAGLDFPEEELELPDYGVRLAPLINRLDSLLCLARQGSLLREGAHIVLVGRPNVGKSSLINQLSGEDLALVSDIPGTTRDTIRQQIHIDGLPINIVDTAGLRISEDIVEQMGMARTRNALSTADAVLLLNDASAMDVQEDAEIIDELPDKVPFLEIFNKVDLSGQSARVEKKAGKTAIYLSAKTGEGISLLKDEIKTMVGWHQDAGVFMARERHIQALQQARQALERAGWALKQPEVFAEELRLTQEALSAITGEFAPDDLLGEIFGRFCIGK